MGKEHTERETAQDQADITKGQEDTEREKTLEQGDIMTEAKAEIETPGKLYHKTRETLKELNFHPKH